MKTTSKFNDLNDTFNVTDDVVQPEVIEKKIDKIKSTSDDNTMIIMNNSLNFYFVFGECCITMMM